MKRNHSESVARPEGHKRSDRQGRRRAVPYNTVDIDGSQLDPQGCHFLTYSPKSPDAATDSTALDGRSPHRAQCTCTHLKIGVRSDLLNNLNECIHSLSIDFEALTNDNPDSYAGRPKYYMCSVAGGQHVYVRSAFLAFLIVPGWTQSSSRRHRILGRCSVMNEPCASTSANINIVKDCAAGAGRGSKSSFTSGTTMQCSSPTDDRLNFFTMSPLRNALLGLVYEISECVAGNIEAAELNLKLILGSFLNKMLPDYNNIELFYNDMNNFIRSLEATFILIKTEYPTTVDEESVEPMTPPTSPSNSHENHIVSDTAASPRQILTPQSPEEDRFPVRSHTEQQAKASTSKETPRHYSAAALRSARRRCGWGPKSRRKIKVQEVQEIEVQEVQEIEVQGVQEIEIQEVQEIKVQGVQEIEVQGIQEIEFQGVQAIEVQEVQEVEILEVQEDQEFQEIEVQEVQEIEVQEVQEKEDQEVLEVEAIEVEEVQEIEGQEVHEYEVQKIEGEEIEGQEDHEYEVQEIEGQKVHEYEVQEYEVQEIEDQDYEEWDIKYQVFNREDNFDFGILLKSKSNPSQKVYSFVD